jgi:TP901 family phage tail tape measure protein
MSPGLAAAGAALAGVGLAMKVAIGKATDFDEAIVNIQAVTGRSTEEMQGLKAELLAMGASSVHGPQAVAEAMYDIVGGVADASTHMDILQAAMNTATAGNADLAGTTKALISVMNSYKFTADKAGFASDVLTRTVGMGVGTMDEFASALPQVTGLANSLGIGFDDLGAMTAYLTTQGNTASQSTTQLAAMMTALLNPNEAMKAGLSELGFATGQAAIEQLGLIGAFQALSGTQTATEKGMAKMSGSVEALRGITSFAGPDAQAFFDTFKNGVDSATAKAAEIQMGSAANQFNLLQSALDGVATQIGTALLPILIDLVKKATPVIAQIADWITKNPQLAATILAVTGGLLVLVPILGMAKTIFGGLGTLVNLAATATGGLSTKMLLVVGPILAVGVAIAGVIAQLQEFQRIAGEAARSAGAAAAPALSNPAITREQVAGAMFAELQKNYGDLGARLIMGSGSLNVDNLIDEYMKAGKNPNAGSGRFRGWDAVGGSLGAQLDPNYNHNVALENQMSEYLRGQMGVNINTGQPAWINPQPLNSGGGMNINGPITVIANSPTEFERKLQEERQRLG